MRPRMWQSAIVWCVMVGITASQQTFHVPTDVPPAELSAGMILNLYEEGVLDDHLRSGRGSVVNLLGGQIGGDFEALGSLFHGLDGHVGRGFVGADSAVVNLAGAVLEDFKGVGNVTFVQSAGGVRGTIWLKDRSWASLAGGSANLVDVEESSLLISQDVEVDMIGLDSSDCDISGGRTRSLRARHASQLRIHGGVIETSISLREGSTAILEGGVVPSLHVPSESSVTVRGFDFRLNGIPLTGLISPGDQVPLDFEGILTGVLSDGVAFAYDGRAFAAGTLLLEQSEPFSFPDVTFNTSVRPAPIAIGAGQSIIIPAYDVVPDSFVAGPNSRVIVDGGRIDESFRAIGADVDVRSGKIEDDAEAYDGARIHVHGGRVTNFTVHRGASIVIESGNYISTELEAMPGAHVELVGLDFLTDAQPIFGEMPYGESARLEDRSWHTLQVILRDGTHVRRLSQFLSPDANLVLRRETFTGIPGDVTFDGYVNMRDIDLLSENLRRGSIVPHVHDVNGDGRLTKADHTYWVHDIVGTSFGDANLDREFGSDDLAQVFSRGKYETDQRAGWAEGDWNGDGIFGSDDMVTAFVDGGYENGPRLPAAAVPEPTSVLLLMAGLIGVAIFRRRLWS